MVHNSCCERAAAAEQALQDQADYAVAIEKLSGLLDAVRRENQRLVEQVRPYEELASVCQGILDSLERFQSQSGQELGREEALVLIIGQLQTMDHCVRKINGEVS